MMMMMMMMMYFRFHTITIILHTSLMNGCVGSTKLFPIYTFNKKNQYVIPCAGECL
jgi:hypothetical protein